SQTAHRNELRKSLRRSPGNPSSLLPERCPTCMASFCSSIEFGVSQNQSQPIHRGVARKANRHFGPFHPAASSSLLPRQILVQTGGLPDRKHSFRAYYLFAHLPKDDRGKRPRRHRRCETNRPGAPAVMLSHWRSQLLCYMAHRGVAGREKKSPEPHSGSILG